MQANGLARPTLLVITSNGTGAQLTTAIMDNEVSVSKQGIVYDTVGVDSLGNVYGVGKYKDGTFMVKIPRISQNIDYILRETSLTDGFKMILSDSLGNAYSFKGFIKDQTQLKVDYAGNSIDIEFSSAMTSH